MPSRLFELTNDLDTISERLDRFEMRLARHLTSTEARVQAEKIVDALTNLPARDKLILTMEISDDAITISAPSEKIRLIEHIDSFHEDGEPIKFRIEILKEVEQQRLSVYSLTALGAYLDNTDLSETINALAKRFHNLLIFECHADAPGFGSSTLRFMRAGEAILDYDTPSTWRSRSLGMLQDSAYRTGSTGSLLPQDFAVAEPIGVASLDAFMARAGATLSAMFLCNMSDLNGNQLGYRISGYKLLTGTVADLTNLVDNSGSLLKIAIWACGAEGSSDKIGLARNVISLCVDRLEDVPAHPEIWDAIQSNYQIYLKENISTYLEVRNKLAELLAESTHKTHTLAEGLLDSIRNGVLVVLTFLLTVVVINGLKDTGVKVIFSAEYLAIALALLFLITIAVWASCQDARSRFDQSATATNQLLNRMYAQVIIPAEIEQQVKPTIDENRGYLTRQSKRYQNSWLIFAALVSLMFLIGYLTFGRVSESGTPSASQANIRPNSAFSQPEEGDAHGEDSSVSKSSRQPPTATDDLHMPPAHSEKILVQT